MKESDLFIYVKDYFQKNPCNEIYTEVRELEGGRPDIVVRTNKRIVTVVEMKTTVTMTLLEQAINWRYKANYIYIAIPEPKNSKINKFALRILKEYGIGILFIRSPKEWEIKYLESGQISHNLFVMEELKPKLFRAKKEIVCWNDVLKDIYRCENNIEGGSKGGGYNTPYKDMIIDIKKYIYGKGNEFISLTELIKELSSIDRHYSNPKESLHVALVNIEDKQFETKTENKQVFFRLKEDAYKNYNIYKWKES